MASLPASIRQLKDLSTISWRRLREANNNTQKAAAATAPQRGTGDRRNPGHPTGNPAEPGPKPATVAAMPPPAAPAPQTTEAAATLSAPAAKAAASAAARRAEPASAAADLTTLQRQLDELESRVAALTAENQRQMERLSSLTNGAISDMEQLFNSLRLELRSTPGSEPTGPLKRRRITPDHHRPEQHQRPGRSLPAWPPKPSATLSSSDPIEPLLPRSQDPVPAAPGGALAAAVAAARDRGGDRPVRLPQGSVQPALGVP
ncbi:MAG: hypothetical protein WDO24_04155 [Pseudomonadota bacterium]